MQNYLLSRLLTVVLRCNFQKFSTKMDDRCKWYFCEIFIWKLRSFRVCGSRENINVIYRAASAQRYVLMSPESPPYTFLYASARCKQPRGESSLSGRLTVVTSMWHRTARANLFFNGWFIPNCKHTGHRCGWWMVSLRFIGYSWIRTYPATHEVIRSKLG